MTSIPDLFKDEYPRYPDTHPCPVTLTVPADFELHPLVKVVEASMSYEPNTQDHQETD